MTSISQMRLAVAWGILVMTLSGSGCGPTVPPPDLVAQLDGEPVPHEDFEEFLEGNVEDGSGVLGSDVLSALLDQFLTERLLARLAIDRFGSSASGDVRFDLAKLVGGAIEDPDEIAVATYYQQHKASFDLPERVYLRQFLFSDRHTADRMRDLWVRGTSYEVLVGGLSDNPMAHVGEEGDFSRRDLPPAFAEVLFGLADGEVSEVMTADYGFHVFQVVRHLSPGLAPLAEVSVQIFEELLQSQRQEALSRLVEEARGRYNVRVFERNVPFNYQGMYGADRPDANS